MWASGNMKHVWQTLFDIFFVPAVWIVRRWSACSALLGLLEIYTWRARLKNTNFIWQCSINIAFIIIIRTFTSGNVLSHLTLFCDAGLFIPPNAFQRWRTGIMVQSVIMTNQTSKHFETRRKVCVTPLGLKLNKKCVWFVICIHAYTDIYCVIYEKHTWYVRKTTVNT